MTEVKNNTHTAHVHGVISVKLAAAREHLTALKRQQHDIDLKIEDHSRVVMALERTEATLSAALDRPPVTDEAIEESLARAIGEPDPEDVMSKALERQEIQDAAE